MVMANFLAYYNILPSWFWHASWNGITIADLGIPIFLFAMGIGYQLSFERRFERSGKLSTILHFLKRYLTLFIFGFFGYFLAMGKIQWEVLQTISTVGIFSLGFMFIRPLMRIIVALVLTVIYQITILTYAQNWVLSFAETGLGGPYAVLSWNFILITGSVLAYWLKSDQEKNIIGVLAIWALINLFIGILISLVIPFNKHLVSISYIIFSTGVAIVGILLFHIITEIGHKRILVFDSLGRNALVCYITSQLLGLLMFKFLPNPQNNLLLTLISIILLLICIGLAQFLDTKKVYIRL